MSLVISYLGKKSGPVIADSIFETVNCQKYGRHRLKFSVVLYVPNVTIGDALATGKVRVQR